jgi:hypothetical protein
MADADAEIVALLREIRDLQQAHFAKYCEFTTAVREQQKEALERQQATQLLAEVDDQWPDYTFTVPTKGGEELQEWQGILRQAKEGHASGEKPHVLFEWSPK